MPIHDETEDRPDDHPRQHDLERFMRGGGLPREQVRAIVRHLLTECPDCLEITRGHWKRGRSTRALTIQTEREQTWETAGFIGGRRKASVF